MSKAQIESLNLKVLNILDYLINIENTIENKCKYYSLNLKDDGLSHFYKLCAFNRFGIFTSLNSNQVICLFEIANAFVNSDVDYFKNTLETADAYLSTKKEHPGIRKFSNPEDIDKWVNLISLTNVSNIPFLKESIQEPNRKLKNSFILETENIGYLTIAEMKKYLTSPSSHPISSSPVASASASAIEPEKKSVGRPKKIVIDEIPEPVAPLTEKEPVKKAVGRPKKVVEVSSEIVKDEIKTEPEKKKAGRPKKVVEDVEEVIQRELPKKVGRPKKVIENSLSNLIS